METNSEEADGAVTIPLPKNEVIDGVEVEHVPVISGNIKSKRKHSKPAKYYFNTEILCAYKYQDGILYHVDGSQSCLNISHIEYPYTTWATVAYSQFRKWAKIAFDMNISSAHKESKARIIFPQLFD